MADRPDPPPDADQKEQLRVDVREQVDRRQYRRIPGVLAHSDERGDHRRREDAEHQAL